MCGVARNRQLPAVRIAAMRSRRAHGLHPSSAVAENGGNSSSSSPRAPMTNAPRLQGAGSPGVTSYFPGYYLYPDVAEPPME